MKKMQHEKSATHKKSNMVCNMKKVHTKILQCDKSET